MIWLPERQVLCCGDNYYGCWPNLYAIRGSQYRDIAGWLDSLDEILSYSATYLLPGHTRPLCGKEEVRSVLTGFRDAIRYVLEKTLAGMNEGKDIDTLASEIVLPQEYASLPYLGEYYGCVEWTVRAIFTAYLGWFDGNPTNLHPLPPKERAEKAVALYRQRYNRIGWKRPLRWRAGRTPCCGRRKRPCGKGNASGVWSCAICC